MIYNDPVTGVPNGLEETPVTWFVAGVPDPIAIEALEEPINEAAPVDTDALTVMLNSNTRSYINLRRSRSSYGSEI